MRIDELVVGDLVLSRDEFAQESASEYKAVEEVFVREGLLWELRIAGRTIRTTAEHPFFRDGVWTEANRLSEGDRLLLEDGSSGVDPGHGRLEPRPQRPYRRPPHLLRRESGVGVVGLSA